MNSTSISFWDTVVTNLAPIIIALTGFGAMVGGFWMQKRMMDKQNEKIDRNADKADSDRQTLNTKLDKVADATNGLAVRNEQIARNLGVMEGKEQARVEIPPPSSSPEVPPS